MKEYNLVERMMQAFCKFLQIYSECIGPKKKKEYVARFPKANAYLKKNIYFKFKIKELLLKAFDETEKIARIENVVIMPQSNRFHGFCRHLRNAIAHNRIRRLPEKNLYRIYDEDNDGNPTAIGYIEMSTIHSFVRTVISDYEN